MEIVLGPGGMHAMQPEQLEIVWGISKEYLRKSFGKIANKVIIILIRSSFEFTKNYKTYLVIARFQSRPSPDEGRDILNLIVPRNC